jgi:alpha-mannosidase
VRPSAAQVSIVEEGPVRARLRIEQELDLPAALDGQRRSRAATMHRAQLVTEVTLYAGERRVELSTRFDNGAADHRLRAHVAVPVACDRIDVEHGLCVVSRPIGADPLGHGTERAAPTGQHHAFVDVGDGRFGVALFSRGLPEHEAQRDGGGTDLALTLLRSVGWLSRGDLSVMTHAAGPVVPTPGAQELGPHRFDYALLLHRGNWEEGGVLDEALRYQAPPIAVRAGGSQTVPADTPLVATSPGCVRVTAIYPSRSGVVVRLCNASPRPIEATVAPGWAHVEVAPIDPLERPLAPPLPRGARLPLRPFEIATFLVR